jgi:hypothetical protein
VEKWKLEEMMRPTFEHTVVVQGARDLVCVVGGYLVGTTVAVFNTVSREWSLSPEKPRNVNCA